LARPSWQPPDEALPDTGVGLELERLLAPVFVRGSAHYGTRASTLAYFGDEATVLSERTFGAEARLESEVAWRSGSGASAWATGPARPG
jgi:uncharacterized protein with NRDE domain